MRLKVQLKCSRECSLYVNIKYLLFQQQLFPCYDCTVKFEPTYDAHLVLVLSSFSASIFSALGFEPRLALM